MSILSNFNCALHGSAVVWDGQGILLLGEAGVGKSSLAKTMIDAGARLIADDLTGLFDGEKEWFLGFPRGADTTFRGWLHLRGQGWVQASAVSDLTPLCLVVLIGPYPIPEILQKQDMTKILRLEHIFPTDISRAQCRAAMAA